MAAEVVQIGPFTGGLNTYSDNTSVLDNELVIAENFELDLDGSLVSRPPIVDNQNPMTLGLSGNINVLGYYYNPGGVAFLVGSDGLSSTYYFNGTSWTLITSTFAASAITQYNDLAYLQAPLTSANPGGSWSPSAGFTAISAMPKGSVLIAHKNRLWASSGSDAGTGQNGTRLYLSDVAAPTSWPGNFISIGPGDGQNIVQVMIYFNDLLVLKTNSIYRFSYSTDPSTGTPSKLSPDIGLSDRDCVVFTEGIIYFVYTDKVYQISNYQITQINQKVPLVAGTTSNIYKPFALSVFNRRLIVSYWDTMYVYSLRTQRWTTWKSSVYGPVGKIVQLKTNTGQATAVTHSSAPVAIPTGVVNFILNPKGTTNTTGYSVGTSAGSGSASLATTTTTGQGGVGNTNVLRSTATATLTYVDVRYTAPVTAGQTYTFSCFGRTNNTGLAGTLFMLFTDSGGATLATNSVAVTLGAAFGASQFTVSGTAPAGTVNALLILRGTGSVVSGNVVDITYSILTLGTTVYPFFDGDNSNNSTYRFDWNGTANASTSTRTPTRKARTLTIADGVSAGASEQMTCTLQTKNYNYESAGTYKRLFYWGIDAIFRGRVTAYANSVRALSSTATWDQQLVKTWADVLPSLWSAIGSADTSTIVSTVDTSASTSGRKFIKLGRSFRFRQVNFRIVFNTDGSSTTAPVRIFGIMTRVNVKEAVVKQVS